MDQRDEFLAWVDTTLAAAERALHDGDASPRCAIWSRRDPVTVLGAWRNAYGHAEVDALFAQIAKRFTSCTAYAFEIVAAEVLGDVAYTVGFERISTHVDGAPTTYTLRATQIYRREDGEWKVVHRHGSAPPG